mgnify:CR=1 FL=1
MFSTTLASLVLIGNAAAMSLPGLRGGSSSQFDSSSSSSAQSRFNRNRNRNRNHRSLTPEEQAYESSCYPILLAYGNASDIAKLPPRSKRNVKHFHRQTALPFERRGVNKIAKAGKRKRDREYAL